MVFLSHDRYDIERDWKRERESFKQNNRKNINQTEETKIKWNNDTKEFNKVRNNHTKELIKREQSNKTKPNKIKRNFSFSRLGVLDVVWPRYLFHM